MVALNKDGTLWAWGGNGSGQLGVGAGRVYDIPTEIGTATDWVAVSCGGRQTCAIKQDGTLWAWGDNRHGQLGLGDARDRIVPTEVGDAADWAAVSCGGRTPARQKDGTCGPGATTTAANSAWAGHTRSCYESVLSSCGHCRRRSAVPTTGRPCPVAPAIPAAVTIGACCGRGATTTRENLVWVIRLSEGRRCGPPEAPVTESLGVDRLPAGARRCSWCASFVMS